jgi:hypothetical protein
MRVFGKFALLSIVVILTVQLLPAQTLDSCDTRDVVVNVRDRSGKLVVNLPASAFRAKIHGQPVTVLSDEINVAPGRVVVLLDASGSITGSQHTWETARLIAGDLLSSNPRLNVALLVFAAGIEDQMGFSHAPNEIFHWLRQFQKGAELVPAGKRQTAFLDSVLYAANLLGETVPGDAIYAVSDGGDNLSRHTQSDVERTLLDKNVRFFVFYMTGSNFPTEEQSRGVSMLQEMANNTGGAVIDIPDTATSILYDLSPKGRARMSADLQQMYDLMQYFYVLKIKLPPRNSGGS